MTVRGAAVRRHPFWINGSFAVFWTARTISWAGSGVSGVVLPVLVYDRTGSAALTALIAAAEALPYLAFGLLAGALADRLPRRRLMAGCDLGCAALMATVPVAWALGQLSTTLVILVAFGCATAFVFFDAASFGAVPALAGRERVVGAVSGLSAASAVTAAVAPALAGGLLAVMAPAQAVIADAASYLISAALLMSVRRPFETLEQAATTVTGGPTASPQPAVAARGGRAATRAAIAEGLRFLWRQPLLRTMTLLAAAPVSVSGGAEVGLIVVYAVRALGLAKADPRIGLLYSAGAAGSAVAAVTLPRVRRWAAAGRVTLWFLALDAGTLAGVALAPGFAAALCGLCCWQFCYSMVTINGIALRQELTPDHLQSRVNTTGRMLGWGGYPLGALIGGGLASVLPVRVALLVMCAPVAAAALLGLRSPLNAVPREASGEPLPR